MTRTYRLLLLFIVHAALVTTATATLAHERDAAEATIAGDREILGLPRTTGNEALTQVDTPTNEPDRSAAGRAPSSSLTVVDGVPIAAAPHRVELNDGAHAAAQDASSHHTSREDLVGTWRLVQIGVTGPRGAEIDPFYGPTSDGLLIYDRAGWFSVQIMSTPRPKVDVPSERPAPDASAHAAARAAALDSYYAYYGTWTFDTATSTVTHQALGAMYPSEANATYTQRVDVHHGLMTFTRTEGSPPHQRIQTKVWKRAVRSETDSRQTTPARG